MLFVHCARRAASRAICKAGNKRAIKIPMIAITTNNSTNVKPAALRRMRMLLLAAAQSQRPTTMRESKKEMNG
jgi:hypothetical protein